MKKSFEEDYKRNKNYFGGRPSELILKSGKYLTKGNALDIGCGQGRDTLFVAKKYKTTAIDLSEEGIKELREKARKKELKIKTKVIDATKFKFEKKYDLIICMNTLQFIEKEQLRKLVKRMKENTRPRGINIVQSFTDKNPFKRFAHIFKKGELKGLYSDWKILNYTEKFTPYEKHGTEERHRHHIVQLIATKP